MSTKEKAAAIRRQKEACARAAAKSESKVLKQTGGRWVPEVTCPICIENYTKVRFKTYRPCCKVELCTQCDHKSLHSGKCYFCREDAGEFPELQVRLS